MASNCSSCGAGVIWVTSPAGKKMPLDARAVEGDADARLPAPPRKPTLYEIRGPADDPQAVKVEGLVPESPVYLSHFATCANAAQHSRKR